MKHTSNVFFGSALITLVQDFIHKTLVFLVLFNKNLKRLLVCRRLRFRSSCLSDSARIRGIHSARSLRLLILIWPSWSSRCFLSSSASCCRHRSSSSARRRRSFFIACCSWINLRRRVRWIRLLKSQRCKKIAASFTWNAMATRLWGVLHQLYHQEIANIRVGDTAELIQLKTMFEPYEDDFQEILQ